jgi:hypothetical protein
MRGARPSEFGPKGRIPLEQTAPRHTAEISRQSPSLVKAACLGLGAYLAYAVVVGAGFTYVAAGLFTAAPPSSEPAALAPPTVETVRAGADRRDVRAGSSSPIVIRLIVPSGDREFNVTCHTTADRATADVLVVDPGDIGPVYKELGCR